MTTTSNNVKHLPLTSGEEKLFSKILPADAQTRLKSTQVKAPVVAAKTAKKPVDSFRNLGSKSGIGERFSLVMGGSQLGLAEQLNETTTQRSNRDELARTFGDLAAELGIKDLPNKEWA